MTEVEKKPSDHRACLLCNSNKLILSETIKADELIHLYKRSLNLDINDYLPADLVYYQCDDCQLGQFVPCPLGGPELYETLQRKDWYYLEDKPEYDIVTGIIAKKKNPSVLEIGAGRGAFAQKILKSTDYVGLEFNELAIDRARSAKISLLNIDVEEYSNFNKKFDFVVSFQVLEHVANPGKFISSAVRCLKPGGHLILAVPNKRGVAGLMPNIPLDMPPHHATHWNEKTMSKLAEVFGLTVSDIVKEEVAQQHAIVAKKYTILRFLASSEMSEEKLLQTSFQYKLKNSIASLFARFINVSLKNIEGHTIIGVFKNPH